MKRIALIPARYEASRFPGKLMAPLGGIPVVRRTYAAVTNTGLFDDVMVVTDSPEIYTEITHHGGRAYMSQRPHETGSDRIAEAAATLDADIVVNVQGDEPFTSREPLEKLLAVFDAPDAAQTDLASLMQTMHDRHQINDPNFVKVVVDQNGYALLFSRAPIPYPRATDIRPPYYEHIGVYAFRRQALLDFANTPATPLERIEKIECLRYLETGKKIKMILTDYMGIEIDTPEDLLNAEKHLANTPATPPQIPTIKK
ncbi:MAG: 3-deoxy-manno-octulosonate cytidylyltransferase [Prevotellaceae bacterium]|jgi:3-deoxy-D-manno-octulosonate cytidylyltransferase|nr:3-deoxy-manno-octulosonate cytidylyltransferase [Prevotellaceae bacterium]